MANADDTDLSINFDEWLRSRLRQHAPAAGHAAEPDVDREVRVALRALQLYTARHPRPSQVNQKQAAEMLGVSPRTVYNLIRAGTLKLNRCGMIPIELIDNALQPA